MGRSHASGVSGTRCFWFADEVRGHGSFIKQSGPIGRFARVVVEVSTSRENPHGAIQWGATEAQIPAEFRGAVSRGLVCVLTSGGYLNYVADGLVVRVVGGACHPTDSNELSFEKAAAIAFKNAVGKP